MTSTQSNKESGKGKASSSTRVVRLRSPNPREARQGLRGCRNGSFCFADQRAQIGRRIAEAQDALAGEIGPAFANLSEDETPRHLADTLFVELFQRVNVKGHDKCLDRLGLGFNP